MKKTTENFKKALSLNGENLIYLNNLYLCYKSLNDKENSDKILQKMNSITPNTSDDYIQFAQILYDRKDYEGAKTYLIEGLKKFPNNPILKGLFNQLNKS